MTTPQTVGQYEREAQVIERLTRIEVTLEKHIEDETITLNELKQAIDSLQDIHSQARGGAKLIGFVVLFGSMIGGLWAWARTYITLK